MKRALLILAVLLFVIVSAGLAYIHYTSVSPDDDQKTLASAVTASTIPSNSSPATPQDHPDLVHQLPSGAFAIVFADVSQLRASAFAKDLAALVPQSEQDPQYAAFVRATDFDYSRDLDRAAMAFWPHTAPTSIVVLAEGRFDRKRIASYALQNGRVTNEDGYDVYEVPEEGSDRHIRFAFLAPSRMVLADGPALDAVLKPTGSDTLDPAISARIAQVSGAAIFSVARTENLPQDIGIDESRYATLAHLLRSVHSISIAGQPAASDFHIAANADCDSAVDALQLMTLLDGLRWMSRATLADPKVQRQVGPQWRPLDELLKSASLTHTGRTLRLRTQITEQMLAEAASSSSGNASSQQ